jgi:hypothetical protein
MVQAAASVDVLESVFLKTTSSVSARTPGENVHVVNN